MHIHPLGQSFRYALRGLRAVAREERNFRIQIAAACAAILLALLLKLRVWETIVILFVSAFVLVLELLNSITERLVDVFRPRLHHAVGEIKDIMAGAVFVASLVSVLVALLLFLPRILEFVS